MLMLGPLLVLSKYIQTVLFSSYSLFLFRLSLRETSALESILSFETPGKNAIDAFDELQYF